MSKGKIVCVICAGLMILSLALGYINMPDTVILYKDREWKSAGVSKLVNLDDSVETSGDALVPRKVGDYSASAAVFGIPYKSVKVKVLEDEELIVGGQAVGIRLYSKGLVVVAVGRVNENGKSPAEKAGIREGSVIEKINGKEILSPEEFSQIVEVSESVTLTVRDEDSTRDVTLKPEISDYDGVKRIGLWVRDSTAGVGTLTYIEPDSLIYGALGHAVSDVDTGVRFEVERGSIEECAIGDIVRGEKGSPGELKGIFYTGAKILGDIAKNEAEGIFGNALGVPEGERVTAGHKSEIKKGKAYIRTSLDGKTVEDYEIEILKVNKNTKNPSKGLVIKITDNELIEKTGGIVQGMSGSPILQDGKLIGAVTHVLVNDPTKGYGVFIENMLKSAFSAD